MSVSALMVFDDSAQAKKVKDIEDKVNELIKSASAVSGYLVVAEVQASGGGGGSIDGATWNVRPINTVLAGESTVKGGVFTLKAGMWSVEGKFPAYRAGSHRARLVRADSGKVLLLGSSAYAFDGSESMSESCLLGTIELQTDARLRVEHWAETSVATNGMGYPADFGDPEVYGQIVFRRLS